MKILYLAIIICLLLVVPCQAATLKIGECTSCDSSDTPDNQLTQGDVHFNKGANESLATGWFLTNEFRSIIKFPLTQGVLTGATITAATFGCEVTAANGGGNTTIAIHRISTANAGWTEGVKVNATATAGETDWVHQSHEDTAWAGSNGLKTGNPADVGGVDYITPSHASFNGTSTGAKTATFNAAGITYLNNQIGFNAQFLLFTSDAFNNNEFTVFASSDKVDATLRPFLELTFTPLGADGQARTLIIRR